MIDGKHISPWLDEKNPKRFESLKKDIEVDVAIVGGGMAGLSIGTMLKMEGLTVAVLESNRIANYITGATTAKISITSGLIYSYIFSTFGEEFAIKFKEAYKEGFDKIPEIIAKLGIQCDYRHIPFYILSSKSEFSKNLKKEYDVLKKLKIDAKLINNVPYPFEDVEIALVHENQAEFNPKKYLNALADFINNEGSYVFEKTKVHSIKNIENNDNHKNHEVNGNHEINENNDNHKKIAISKNGKVIAKNIVIATNTPIYDPDEIYKFMNQNKSYLLGLYTKEKFKKAMFLETEPFHTLRTTPTPKGELLIIAGEHQKVGVNEDTWDFYKNMRESTEKIVDVESFEYYWTGGDNISVDRVPFIGETSHKGIYTATGFGSWGMTSGTIAGIVIKDLITGKENSYYDIFNPLRFKNKKSISEDKKIEEIKKNPPLYWDSLVDGINKMNNNEAKIVEYENQTIAIYKDDDSNLFVLDGECTHKSCNLRWNSAEKKWECPCHGAVFDYKGKVIRGPAIADLKKIS